MHSISSLAFHKPLYATVVRLKRRDEAMGLQTANYQEASEKHVRIQVMSIFYKSVTFHVHGFSGAQNDILSAFHFGRKYTKFIRWTGKW